MIAGLRQSAAVRHTLDGLRSAFPTAYARTRNGAALIALYAQRLRGQTEEAYPDAFWEFHDVGDWDGFARVVIAYADHPKEIVDVGCGHGLALAAFARMNPTLRLRGLDGSPAAIARARARGLTVDSLDVQTLDRAGAERVASGLVSCDLAICLEVAEHLPAWHGGKLLTIVAAPRRVVFSAAHLNQGGTLHVNEQPAEYWIDRLAARGQLLSARDDEFRREIAALDLPSWYGENVHLFERRH